MKETWTHKDAEREAEEDGGAEEEDGGKADEEEGAAEDEEGGTEDEGGALEAGDEDMVPSVRSTSTTTPAISASACTRKPEGLVSSSPEAASKPRGDAREEWPREEWPLARDLPCCRWNPRPCGGETAGSACLAAMRRCFGEKTARNGLE
jgi:hypothetical protein